MAPAAIIVAERDTLYPRRLEGNPGSWRDNATLEMFIIESWSQGLLVGALMIMACVTISNMKTGIFLPKLILLELFLAMPHGTFCFMSFDGYGWYLSSTATLLYISWIIHNVVAWIKIKPFMTPKASWIFIGSLSLTVAPILLQICNNFRFFNNIDDMYTKVRPFEVLFRDPWWIFSCIFFFFVIKTRYTVSVGDLMKGHPRFAIMLLAMVFSIVFTILDLLASVISSFGAVDGLNPYWKIALVFKSLTDVIILDDFRACLDKLSSNLVENKATVIPKPPPVPPKDYPVKEKAATITCTTARTSPTLVTSQSPRESPRTATTQSVAGPKFQRPHSVREKLNRVASHLSPLPSTDRTWDDPITPSEKSPRSGGSHVIHVKMDLGLNKFVNSVVGRRPPSLPAESPLDPTWPRSTSLRRGHSVLSRGTLSTNARSSRSSMPSLPERTPTSHGSLPTPRAI